MAGFNIDRWLSFPNGAKIPSWVHQTPKGGNCETKKVQVKKSLEKVEKYMQGK